MGIADNAVVLPQLHPGDGGLPLSLVYADTNGYDFRSHLFPSIRLILFIAKKHRKNNQHKRRARQPGRFSRRKP
jgi:hypothetical protein